MINKILEKVHNATYIVHVWGYDHEDYEYIVEGVEKGVIKRVIFLMAEEYHFLPFFQDTQSFRILKGWFEKNQCDFKIVLGCDISEEYGWLYDIPRYSDNLISWRTFFAHQVVHYCCNNQIHPYGHNEKLQKHFVSLNGRAHTHRVRFIDHMYKYGLNRYGYISFQNFENRSIDNYTCKWWEPQKMIVDPEHLDSPDGMVDILLPPPQFKDALWSLICESTTDAQFITEKTYIPIFHKRPFLIYGHPKANLYMKSLGFQLFDEIIDYSFDSIDNDAERVDAYMKEVQKICNMEVNKQRQILQKKIDYNHNHMLKLVNNKKIKKSISKCLPKFDQFHLHMYTEYLNIADRLCPTNLFKGI